LRKVCAQFTCIRQHTSAYVSIRQHTSAYVSDMCQEQRLRKVYAQFTCVPSAREGKALLTAVLAYADVC
jgi:hypothetical protein